MGILSHHLISHVIDNPMSLQHYLSLSGPIVTRGHRVVCPSFRRLRMTRKQAKAKVQMAAMRVKRSANAFEGIPLPEMPLAPSLPPISLLCIRNRQTALIPPMSTLGGHPVPPAVQGVHGPANVVWAVP
jgi:hypothetical protein